MVEHTYGDGKTFVFDPEVEAPEIPCPVCFIMNPLLSFGCGDCGFPFYKQNEKSVKQMKEEMGFRQEVRESTRSARSASGHLKQSMKSHKKYAKHLHPVTKQPFVSILDRFENDPIYKYRMMAAGWSADMCEPLQKLLETKILGDRQSFRTQDQIRGARTTYVTHPELGEPGSGGLTAENYRNPDWARTKEHRGEFRGGLLLARSGQPVAPQVANMLQQHFNMDVPTIEEEDPNDGEGQPSAGAGAGYSTGNQGTWWIGDSYDQLVFAWCCCILWLAWWGFGRRIVKRSCCRSA